MERRHGADRAGAGVVVEPFSAGLHDAVAGRQQRLRRGIAERHQHVRVHELDLPLDEWQADLRLLRRRGAVAGRPPWNDIGDVSLAAVEPDCRDHPIEQFSGASDERQALDVLVAPGRFADEHDAGLRIAVGKHQPRRGVFERTALEIFQQRPQRFQRRRRTRRFARDGGRRFRRGRYFAARNCRHRGRHFPHRAGWCSLADRNGGGRGVGLAQPIDRLLHQSAIDPSLQIKGQQLPNIRCGFRDQIHYANLIWIAPA